MRYPIIVGVLICCLLTGCSASLNFDQPRTGAAAQSSSTTEPHAEAGSSNSETVEELCTRTPGACAVEDGLIYIVDYLTLLAELCGAFIIAVGVLRALGNYLPHLFRRTRDDDEYQEDIRLRLGKSLALALEFALGADILKTAVAPSFEIIAQLAAIIVLRTALNYFLERELRQVEQRRADLHLDNIRQPGEAT